MNRRDVSMLFRTRKTYWRTVDSVWRYCYTRLPKRGFRSLCGRLTLEYADGQQAAAPKPAKRCRTCARQVARLKATT